MCVIAAAGCQSGEVAVRSGDPVVTLEVVPTSETLVPGETLQLRAAPRDARGRLLADRSFAVVVANPAVARVSPLGLLTATAPGSTQIGVSTEGKSAAMELTVVPVTGAIAECGAPQPGWIWCDDFEEDRLGAYFEYDSQDSFVRTPGSGFGGSVGMRARFATGQVNAGALHVAFGRTPGRYFRAVDAGTEVYREVYWRIYVRYEAGWIGGGGNKMSRAQSLATPQFAQAMIAHVWSGSSPEQPTINYIGLDPASGIGSGGRLVTRSYNDFDQLVWLGATWGKTPVFDEAHVGKWYCIEAHARLNDPGRSNGVFELWIDGRPEVRQTGLGWMGGFRDYGINTVYLENYWNDGAPQPQERHFDNFVISRQQIGCRWR
jgi:hypothetical protein